MRRLVIAVFLTALLVVSAGVASASENVHIVARGETLSRIAARYGTTVQALVAANNLWNPNFIYAGQALVIPAPVYYPPQPPPPPPVYTPPTSPYPILTYYTVQPGDTLARIAARFGTTWRVIAQANNLFNPNIIYTGQVLAIPRTPTVYTYYVRPGDTLAAIARHYGATVAAISSYNNIFNPNLIYPGMLLRIPVY